MWEWQAPPTSHWPGELCRQGQIQELNPMAHTSREDWHRHTAEGGHKLLEEGGGASFQHIPLLGRSAKVREGLTCLGRRWLGESARQGPFRSPI